jgi:hypothetical protein
MCPDGHRPSAALLTDHFAVPFYFAWDTTPMCGVIVVQHDLITPDPTLQMSHYSLKTPHDGSRPHPR